MSDVKINGKYKDRLFCWIFGREENKANLLDLYNAINNTDYDDVNLIEINTIDDIIYMKMKNDISCILGSDMSLYEHQSSFNPNMPFRAFEYCAKLYDSIVTKRNYDVYGSKLLKFPTPRCYVFYNGKSKHADKEILRLSDAFEGPSEGYEWTTIMLNVNYGHNKELMEKCRALQEYAAFVDQVRQNLETMNLREAVDKAVKEVVASNGVLSGIFSKNISEVCDMCITEYNEAQHLENVKQEGKLEGQNELINAVKDVKNGLSYKELIEKYGQITADNALKLI